MLTFRSTRHALGTGAVRQSLALALPFTILLLLQCGYRTATAAEPRASELVGLVIDAIEKNFAAIDTADLRVHEVMEDATVAERKVTVTKLPDGSEVHVTRAPHSEWYGRILIRSHDFRIDKLPGADAKGVIESHAFVDGTWTQYVPGSTAAWIRKPRGMPGMFPLDPRQVGTDDIRRSVIDILREDTIVSAQLTTSSRGGGLIRIVAKPASGVRTTYEFSAAANFLPIRLSTRWPDGSLLQLVDYEYQDVLNGHAKFLKKVTRSFFRKGATRKPPADGWRQRVVRELVGPVVFNKPISKTAVAITLPPGTRVSDSTRSDVYTSHIPLTIASRTWSGERTGCISPWP